MFTDLETAACRRLVDLALAEDLGTVGDLTGQAVIPSDTMGKAWFVSRDRGILAGLPALPLVFAAIDRRLELNVFQEDGTALQPGRAFAEVHGPVRGILASERIALNFLQHLSGIASQTHRHVLVVADLPCQVLDTRKTLPGWRLLEKYAVRCGGGHNHRMGLFDGILIKDNHLELAWFAGPKPIAAAIHAARAAFGNSRTIEVEVENLDEFDLALSCCPDIVLLDNMSIADMREAVCRRGSAAPQVLLEASGGITLATLRSVAETGVDRISIGALTHSAPALDMALHYQEP